MKWTWAVVPGPSFCKAPITRWKFYRATIAKIARMSVRPLDSWVYYLRRGV